MTKRCIECRAGCHDNYDDNVLLCKIVDPDTRKMYKRGYLCSEHRTAFADDGYEVTYLSTTTG